MNDRVKELRKYLGLSGENFGAKLGLTRMAISKIENSQVGVAESNIKAICREFNVNEDWLRYGKGDMFNELSQISLDDLLADSDPLDIAIMKAYFTLDKDTRRKALKHFQDCLTDKK